MRIGYGTSITVPQSSERWFSEMRAGRCFARGTTLGASVGNFSEIQVFNPVGSGKQLLVYKAMGCEDVGSAIHFRIHNTALATLVGTASNLLVGAAASSGEIRTAQPAALDGTVIAVFYVSARAIQDVASLWCAELSPGQGVLITSNLANENICAAFFWNEA